MTDHSHSGTTGNPTPYLIRQLYEFRILLHYETDPVVATSLRILSDEIIAELSRRNDSVMAQRVAGAAKLVDAVSQIVERKR